MKCSKCVCMKEEPVWGNKVVNDKLRTALDIHFSEQTGAARGLATVQPSRDIPLRQLEMPKQDGTNNILQGLQPELMSCDYIKGKAGCYMPLESFSNSKKCERMVAKIKFPVPLHLLDHLIIPINVRESHWFPAHMNIKSRCMSLLDSSHAYSVADSTAENAPVEILQNGMDSTRWDRCPSSLLGRAPSEDHFAAPTTDRTNTSNGTGTRTAERCNCRKYNYNNR